jgi:hypothetical protein
MIPLQTEAKAWIKMCNGSKEIIHVKPESAQEYHLYNAFPDIDGSHYLGRILFDELEYWIYDGEELAVDEQEQVARFIKYVNL